VTLWCPWCHHYLVLLEERQAVPSARPPLLSSLWAFCAGTTAAPICFQQLYALNSEYKAFIKKHGGLKKLCSRHPERLQFVDDSGCGVLRCAVIHNRLEELKDARDTHLSQSVSYDETAAHTTITEWATSPTAPSASHVAVSPKAKVVLVGIA